LIIFIQFLCIYVVIRLSHDGTTALGAVVFALLYALICLIYIHRCGIRVSRRSGPLLALSAVSLSQVFFCGNEFLRRLSLLVAFTLFTFALYLGCRPSIKHFNSDPLPEDLLRCFACDISVDSISKHTNRPNKETKMNSILPAFWKGILGLVLGIPVFLVAGALLSYDSSFQDLIDSIFTFDMSKLAEETFLIIASLLVFLYLFLILTSLAKDESDNRSDYGLINNIFKKISFLPPITVFVSVIPLLLLYTLFFISQWKYYTSAFVGSLPSGYSYAEYAREGFFQLCTVSTINLLVLFSCTWLIKKNKTRDQILLKVITHWISVYSMILIATAMSKMYLYMKEYGLTPLRVYSSWGMMVLAAIFILFIVKGILNRFPFYTACIYTVVVLFLGLVISNPEKQIARYNTYQFFEGNLNSVDLYLLEELGDPAVPYLLELEGHLPLEDRAEYNLILRDLESLYTEKVESSKKWTESTYDYLTAKRLVNGE
ncbi:MAG: DUF4173 domain-containing protein, partial [Oscillospiraceae bacterium]|nr:DUF4173 domain-containing protein [Oscillospiraceae bacterium]